MKSFVNGAKIEYILTNSGEWCIIKPISWYGHIGKGGIRMKKTKKTLMTAAVLCAAANIGSVTAPVGATALGSGNSKTVYEAPEVEYVDDVEEGTAPGSLIEALKPFKPVDDRVPCVYGPPDWFDKDLISQKDDESKDDPSEAILELNGKYDPEESIPVEVYGPPNWSSSEYDPKDSLPEVVYGPPNWFSDGDVNNDGKMDIEDAVGTIGFVTGNISLTPEQEKKADVNGDGKVDIEDAVRMINEINGNKS